MRVDGVLRLVMLAAAALVWETRCCEGGRSLTVRLCGRTLSDFMSRVCRTYNSPWDDLAEQPAGVVRRKRDIGIADECCNNGCTFDQLSQYCAVSTNSAESLEPHMIADRSAEVGDTGAKAEITPPAVVAERSSAPARTQAEARRARGEVGVARIRGYGRARARVHGRRCWCRRKRRSGRRRSILMGNMGIVNAVSRAAPVVGTVSPLLTWGRTIHADLLPRKHDRFAYVTV